MKILFLFTAVLMFQAASAQDTAIRKSIDTFFEGLHTADTLKIQSVCSVDMLLQTIVVKPGGNRIINEEAGDFYTSVSGIPKTVKIEERLLDCKIQSDGSMAQVWAPYEFYINGKLSHSGVNSFTLYKEANNWKIVYIIDTRKLAVSN